jgi:HEAT repeat protein
MPARSLLVVAAVALGLSLLALTALVCVGKLLRGAREARRRTAEARVRPLLIRLVSGAEDEVLPPTRGADGDAVEQIAAELLGKVRGETFERLVAVLDGRGVLERAHRELGRGTGATRARAAELLGAARHRAAVPDLAALVRSGRRRTVRTVAVRALGRIGDPDAIPAILGALERSVPSRTVAQAVLEIGPAAEPALRRELQSGDAAVRALAAHVLGLSGSVGSGRALADAITTDPDPRVRVIAAESAGRLGVPYAIDALVAALGDDRTRDERAASAEALGRMSAADATSVLAPLVAEPDVRVAHAAACALAGLGAAGRAYLDAFSREDGAPAEHAREALRRAS